MLSTPASWTFAALRGEATFLPYVEVIVGDDDDPWGASGLSATRRILVKGSLPGFTDAAKIEGRLLDVPTLFHRFDDRDLGGIGGAGSATFTIYNDADGSWMNTQETDGTYPWRILGRQVRIGLVRSDATSAADFVPLFSGRVTRPSYEDPAKVTFTAEEARIRSKSTVPKSTFRSNLSNFEGFRSANSNYGKPIPLVFGVVPYAEGFTTVVGWENDVAQELHGRLVIVADTSEPWQVLGGVGRVFWGDARLVDGTYRRGYVLINQGTDGPSASWRNPHTLNAEKGGFYFDDFNREHLHLIVDVVFPFVDRYRDRVMNASVVADSEHVLDDVDTNWCTVASFESPTRYGMAASQTVSGILLPFPDFGGLSMEISRGDTYSNMEGPPSGSHNSGFYLIARWAFETLAGAANYGLVAALAVYDDGSDEYDSLSPNGGGPAYYNEADQSYDNWKLGNPADPDVDTDDFSDSAWSELQMRQTFGHSATADGPTNLSQLSTRQGSGLALFIGSNAWDGTPFDPYPIGDPAPKAPPLRIYGVGIRLFGRIEFPDKGFFARVEGYTDQGFLWTGTPTDETIYTAAGITGLLLDKVLGIGTPDPVSFTGDESVASSDEAFGRQVVDEMSGITLIDDLCKNANRIVLAGEDYDPTDSGTGAWRIKNLRKLGSSVYTFTVLDLMAGARFVPSLTPDDELYSEFELHFQYSRLRGEYDEILKVTPDEKSDDVPQALQDLLIANVATANVGARPLRIEAPWIQTLDSALELLDFVVRNRTVQRKKLTFRSSMVSIPVQHGDTVSVTPTGQTTADTAGKWVVASKRPVFATGSIDWTLVQYINA